MSDPIFQTRPISEAFLRILGAFVLGPLLGVASLATLYNITGWTVDAPLKFLATDLTYLWLGFLFVCLIGAAHSVLVSILSASYGKTNKKTGLLTMLASLLVGCLLASGYVFFDANYFTILASAFLLLLILVEASRLAYSVIRPYVSRGKFSELRALKKSGGI